MKDDDVRSAVKHLPTVSWSNSWMEFDIILILYGGLLEYGDSDANGQNLHLGSWSLYDLWSRSVQFDKSGSGQLWHGCRSLKYRSPQLTSDFWLHKFFFPLLLDLNWIELGRLHRNAYSTLYFLTIQKHLLLPLITIVVSDQQHIVLFWFVVLFLPLLTFLPLIFCDFFFHLYLCSYL